jgi:hypothetical protein
METDETTTDELAWRWHDNVIYGFGFELGEPAEGDWRSDLLLDIDFIEEWLCGAPNEVQFRVAPATLRFHDVTDLAISVDQGDSGGRNALSEWSINRVERQRLDRSFAYWRWTIHLHAPPGGSIAFCASGFTQDQRAEPMLVSEQRLPHSARKSPWRGA